MALFPALEGPKVFPALAEDPGFFGGLVNEAVRSGGSLAHNLGAAVGLDIPEPSLPPPHSDPNASTLESLTDPTFYGETLGGMIPRAVAPVLATMAGGPLAGAAVAGLQTGAEGVGQGLPAGEIAATSARDAVLAGLGAKIGGMRGASPVKTAVGQLAGQEALANAGNIGTNIATGQPPLANTLQTTVGTALVTAPAEALAMRGRGEAQAAPESPPEAPIARPETPSGEGLVKTFTDAPTVDTTPLTETASRVKTLGFRAKVPVLDVGHQELVRPARVFEALDGDKTGPWTETVWRPVSDASYAARERNIATQQSLRDGLSAVAEANGTKLGGVLDALQRETAAGDGPKLTGSERIGISMLAVNDLGKITSGGLLRGNGKEMPALTPEQVSAVVESLTPVERGVAEVLASRFAAQGPEVASVHKALTGEDLPLQTNYFPNQGPKADAITAASPMAAPELFRETGSAPRETTAKSFTREKTENGWQKVRIDALDVFGRNTAQVDYYLEMAPVLKRVAETVSQPEVARELRRLSSKGTNLKSWMQDWIEDAGRPYVGSLPGKGEAAMRKLRTTGTPAVLAGRIPTMLKQPVSMLNAAGEAGYLTPIVKGVVKTIASQRGLAGNKIHREMSELFPEVRTRAISRELEDFERAVAGGGGKLSRGIKETSDFLLQGLRIGDKLAVTAVSKGVFDTEYARNKAVGMPDAKAKAAAIERTKQVLERTQNDARTVALPEMFRQPGELNKFITIFGNELNQALNTNYKNVRTFGRDPKKTAAWLAYGVFAPAMSYALINRALSPTGAAENLPQEVVGQLVGGIPVVGNASQALVQYLATGDPTQLQYVTENTPVGLRAYERMGKGATRAISGKPDATAATDFLSGAASAVGLPGEQIRTTMQAVQDQDPRGLAFSRYQRRAAQ